jgi:preprotein translocase subunit SecE
MFKKMAKFYRDVTKELKFVSWPTKADLKEGTTVVVVISSIVAILLSVIDSVFSLLVRLVLFKG